MQLLFRSSKYLILAVLSCTLLIAWNRGIPDITSLGFSNTFKSSPAKHAKAPVVYPITQVYPIARSVDSVWHNIAREFKLDHKPQSSRVQAEIRKLLADQESLEHILRAAAPYIYFIHKQVKARGLPAELALIPYIESEFNPYDHSKKGATGLWQLMPGTAHELGVKVKSGYDGRRNVIASTKAALAYFNDLGNLFKGNWYLAIAAYNCGQVRVAKVSKRTGSRSFWNLPLPKETKHYVPKLLAVAEIVKHPDKYGVQLPHINNQPVFEELTIKKSVNLQQVAKSSGINIDTLKTLNPDYSRNKKSEPKKGSTTLLVPVNKAPEVKAKLGSNVIAQTNKVEKTKK